MSHELTTKFIDALTSLERDRNVEPMIGLFQQGAAIGNVVTPREFAGPEGARGFWASYRATFGEIESRFRAVIESDDYAALEWTTRGTCTDGRPITYEGVSVLEFEDGKIARFRAYFNPADLGAQLDRDEN